MPLSTWAGVGLSRLLPDLADDSDVLELLSALPPTALLNLKHPSVRTLLQSAARKQTSVETSLHLIRHSLSLAQVDFSDIDEEVALLVNLFQKQQSDERHAVDRARLTLLNTALLEFPKSVVQRVQDAAGQAGLKSMQMIDDGYRQAVTQNADKWVPQPYRVIPVAKNTTSSSRSAIVLSTAVPNDSFLRRYRWTAMRGEYGRLVAESKSER